MLNKFLGDYVSNLETTQLNIAIWKGDVKLRGLKLRKEALDKLNLPIVVLEGCLGELTLTIPWQSLKTQPVRVFVDNVYVLVTPKRDDMYNPKEEEERLQKWKQEKLETLDLLNAKSNSVPDDTMEEAKSNTFTMQLITKIIDNLQVSINNIHVRYEDQVSNPERPFSVGVTLSELSGISTDDHWNEKFISQHTDTIHKLLKLKSLGIYWNTEFQSLAGKSSENFANLIASEKNNHLNHQFILKPVSGTGRLMLNKSFSVDRAKNVALFLFDEFGVVIDDEQYRDLFLLLDLFECSAKQQKYRKFRPPQYLTPMNNPRVWLKFAGNSVLSEIQEKNRRWTWKYIKERRDDRKTYIPLYIRSKLETLDIQGQQQLSMLERKLSFEDIRFYRTIAHKQLAKKKDLLNQKRQRESNGWFSWLGWINSDDEEEDPEVLLEKHKQVLYDAIDFNEDLPAFEIPKECAIVSVTTQLKSGSLTLRQSSHNSNKDIASLVFDTVTLEFLNRPDSFRVALSLKGLELYDGVTEGTLYPLLLRVQENDGELDEPLTIMDDNAHTLGIQDHESQFFKLVFEHNPLDKQADNGLMVKMRNLEVYYNKFAINAISSFLRTTESALESITPLIEAAGSTFDELSLQTRASLQYVLETHKTLDLNVDMRAPIFIFPESCTDPKAHVVVLDSGHATVKSELISNEQRQEESKTPESLMYDKFTIEMTSVQILVGRSVRECLEKIKETEQTDDDLHVVDRISMRFSVEMSILANSDITQLKIAGSLPLLKINFSDRKYRTIMRLVDLVINDEHPTTTKPAISNGSKKKESDWNDNKHGESSEALDAVARNPEHKELEFTFKIEKFVASLRKTGKGNEKEEILAEVYLDQLLVCLVTRPYDMEVSVKLKSLLVNDKMNPGKGFEQMITSKVDNPSGPNQSLLSLVYHSVKPESPEFVSKYESTDQSLDIVFSSVCIVITSRSVLTLYDFILATFVDDQYPDQKDLMDANSSQSSSTLAGASTSTGILKIKAEVTMISFILNNEGTRLSTISLSKGKISMVFQESALIVGAQLGGIHITDDMVRGSLEHFNQLVTIKGDELADFRYETFNWESDQKDYPGYDSSVYFRLGSIQIAFLENAIREILSFGEKFAEMHQLFESARQAAVESATQLQQHASKMRFDVAIKSPIIIFPRGGAYVKDALIANLGEISFTNNFTQGEMGCFWSKSDLAINKIHLSSSFYMEETFPQILQIIDNVDINFTMVHSEHVHETRRPDTEIVGAISDIKMCLTEQQYAFLIEIFNSIMAMSGGSSGDAMEVTGQAITISPADTQVIEYTSAPKGGRETWIYLDCILSLNMIYLEIFAGCGKTKKEMPNSSLCRLTLKEALLKYQTLTDNSTSAELQIHTLEVVDTRPHIDSKFKEIIPAVRFDEPQFMAFIRTSASQDVHLSITVDSPKILLVLDPLFAIRDFFFGAFQPNAAMVDRVQELTCESAPLPYTEESGRLTYTVNIIDVEIQVLEDVGKSNSEAMVLCASQIFIQQTEYLDLNCNQIGLFLCRMDKRSNALRVIDSFDVHLNIDSKKSLIDNRMHTAMTVDVQPFVIRVSYRDIEMITNILNKALALLYQSQDNEPAFPQPENNDQGNTPLQSDNLVVNRPSNRETLKINLDEIQVIFIRDLIDLPILDIHIAKSLISVQDWSTSMKASTNIKLFANMLNIKNSHWEPLIEPWDFTVDLTCTRMTHIKFISDTQLELNITHRFLETLLSTADIFDTTNSPLDTTRDIAVPYLLRNRTGLDMLIWAEPDLNTLGDDDSPGIHKLVNGAELPWRFQNWARSRERIVSYRNRLGIQFIDVSWECINDIAVDTEGIFIYLLRPDIENVAHRMACEVTLKDFTKIITFRSPIVIENLTKFPLDMVMVNYRDEIVSSSFEVPPGGNHPVHILSGYENAIRIKPIIDAKYRWSNEYIYWRGFLGNDPLNTVTCESDHGDIPYRFQVHGHYDRRDKLAMIYPTMTIRISAPFELENLLPFDFIYNIIDETNERSWSGKLSKSICYPIHTAQQGQHLLMSVEVPDAGYESSQHVSFSTPDPNEIHLGDTLVLKHGKSSMRLNLKLSYFEIPDTGGATRISVYCPFVILNKTGIDLHIKSRSISQVTISGPCEDHKDRHRDHTGHKRVMPLMLSFRRPKSKKFVRLRVENTVWSKGINLEATGTITSVVLPQSGRVNHKNKQEVQLGMTIDQGKGRAALTRVITFTPRYIFQNNIHQTVSLHTVCSESIITLNAGERAPIYITQRETDVLMQIRYTELNQDWSSPINLTHIGTNYVKIGPYNEERKVRYIVRDNEDNRDLIKIQISLEGPTIFAFLSKEEQKWPFKIENTSPVDIQFYQQKPSAKDLINARTTSYQSQVYKVPAGESRRYAWDYPFVKHKSLVLDVHGVTREVSLQAIGPLLPLKYDTDIMSIDVVADGPTVILKLLPYNRSKSIFRPSKRSHSHSRKDKNSTLKSVEFEVVMVDTKNNFLLEIKLKGIGISLINRRMQELIYATFHGLELQYSSSILQTSTKCVVQWLQIDNQLYGGLSSTLLYPSFTSKHETEIDTHPFFQAAVVQARDTEHGVDYYKYFTVLLQDVSLEVDEDFLFALLDFSKFNIAGWDAEVNSEDVWSEDLEIPEAPFNEGDVQLYFEAILIQPIKISLSFARTERVNQEQQAPHSYNPVWYMLNIFTMTIGSVNDAPVKLNALIMDNVRLTYPELMYRFTKYYSQEVIYQVHKIIGSADFLGNPVGLFHTVSSGVKDIFYEPYQGFMISDRPQDIGIGIAKGTVSFLSKMVYGLSDSFSKFTESVGKGLSVATLDKKFQDRRRTTRSRNRPKHALYGLAQATTSLVYGLAGGLSGMVIQPISGAKRDGFGGFVKGIGIGLVGVVVKPVIGLVDMANNLTEGIRNTTTIFETNDFDRIRLPRYIDPDGVLRPYSSKEALGQSWLKQAHKGAFFDEIYVAHVELKEEEMIAILTSKKLIVVWAKGLEVNWKISFNQISQVKVEHEFVRITLNNSDMPSKRIHRLCIPELSSRKWFGMKIHEALSTYNHDLNTPLLPSSTLSYPH
ncbi:Vacuolar protein sorting-associated protein 13 [Basidiobolus ranarum]|uniref:Vacuolar protein sorting-associated protein 13 n=1 Tax=Basidiobolus ranarum TaxID=34480 RepID=A0ABR2W744_9FUNG